MEIDTPDGLAGIEEYLKDCPMDLKVSVSGFNGKTVLKSRLTKERFDWNMDCFGNTLVAYGNFFIDIEEAKKYLESLSKALCHCGFINRDLSKDFF